MNGGSRECHFMHSDKHNFNHRFATGLQIHTTGYNSNLKPKAKFKKYPSKKCDESKQRHGINSATIFIWWEPHMPTVRSFYSTIVLFSAQQTIHEYNLREWPRKRKIEAREINATTAITPVITAWLKNVVGRSLIDFTSKFINTVYGGKIQNHFYVVVRY